jgi:hypothetical protein
MGAEAGGMADLYLAASGGQALAGAGNAYVQSRAMRAQGQYARQTAEDDALMLEMQSKSIDAKGARAQALKGKETQALLARQRAAASGQGVDVASASVQSLAADAAGFGAMDAETIGNNTWASAWGVRSEAAQTRRAGRHARDAANFDARLTAATGGLQFGRDLLQAGYEYERFSKPTKGYQYGSTVNGRSTGKPMSDPRNR